MMNSAELGKFPVWSTPQAVAEHNHDVPQACVFLFAEGSIGNLGAPEDEAGERYQPLVQMAAALRKTFSAIAVQERD